MRLFLAAGLPDELLGQVQRVRAAAGLEKLNGWRWIRPARRPPDAAIPRVRSIPRSTVRRARPGAAWRPRRVRFVSAWAASAGSRLAAGPACSGSEFEEVGPGDALATLASELERAARELGWAAESRPFRPHLTLARVERGSSAGRTRGPPARGHGPEAPVRDLVLYRQSARGRWGAVHCARVLSFGPVRCSLTHSEAAGREGNPCRTLRSWAGERGAPHWQCTWAAGLRGCACGCRSQSWSARMIERRDNPTYLPGVRIPDTRGSECGAVRRRSTAPRWCCAWSRRSTPAGCTGAWRRSSPPTPHWSSRPRESKRAAWSCRWKWRREELGGVERMAVLSGPSFAREVADGHPTAVVSRRRPSGARRTTATGDLLAGTARVHESGSGRRAGCRFVEERDGHRGGDRGRVGAGHQRPRRVDHAWAGGDVAPGAGSGWQGRARLRALPASEISC